MEMRKPAASASALALKLSDAYVGMLVGHTACPLDTVMVGCWYMYMYMGLHRNSFTCPAKEAQPAQLPHQTALPQMSNCQ